ncbi:hypothetical protein AB3U99_16590 [Niallia sp. JL1B1071]|uniref:hypothetical protein n=1 Tax=Niallia tiangongensis TaxID=3237105 RepID=UPI0037DC1864
MQVLLISIVCLLIITLIFVVFPSSMTIKGRLAVVAVAFVLSNIGFALQYLYESFMISLGSLLLLVLMLPLFMQKSSRYFFKEEMHSEYITTFTAKDMNKQNIELEENNQLINDKSKPSLKNEDKITSNSIVEKVEQEELKPIQEEDFPLIKEEAGSKVMSVPEETENVNRQEKVSDWVNATLDTAESHPKEDYWKNDNVIVRENSIEAFLEEINANKDNDKEEDHLEDIEEKPNRRYLERLEKIRILDNSDLPKDND